MPDLIQLILPLGYLGLAAVVFAESGLLVGFFLPGDSLLFSVGLIASQGHLNIWIVVPLVCIAAIVGDSVGYWFGAKVGPALFKKEDSLFFKKRYVTDTQTYFQRFGPLTIVLARFIPIARTFAPVLAGVGSMHYPLFLRYNIIGGILWGAGVTILGYFLGSIIPGIDRYLLPIVGAIIVASVAPVALHWWRNR